MALRSETSFRIVTSLMCLWAKASAKAAHRHVVDHRADLALEIDAPRFVGHLDLVVGTGGRIRRTTLGHQWIGCRRTAASSTPRAATHQLGMHDVGRAVDT